MITKVAIKKRLINRLQTYDYCFKKDWRKIDVRKTNRNIIFS